MYTLTELLLNNPGVKIRLKFVDDEYPYIDVKASRGDSSVRSYIYESIITREITDEAVNKTIKMNIETLIEAEE